MIIGAGSLGAGLGAGLAAGLAVIGAGVGNGLIVMNALKGMTRQPEMEGKLRSTMILGMGFVDGVAVIGLVVGLLMGLFKA